MHPKGQAALASTLFLLAFSVVMGGTISASALRAAGGNRLAKESSQSYIAAESAMEDALYRLRSGRNLGSYSIVSLGGAAAEVSVAGTDGGKDITIVGSRGSARRKIRARVTTDVGVSFFYGVQVGAGGLTMDNNSRIEGSGGAAGNIYTLGGIDGDSGATITGNITASGTIDNVVVHGDARAARIGERAQVCGNAYYGSIHADALAFLNNPSSPTCPSPLTPGTAFPNQPPNLGASSLPISDQTIQDWKEDAGCGVQPAVSPCLHSGDFVVNASQTLGPKTITGNLSFGSNNKILTVGGTIYVKGNIDIGNGNALQCSPAYGAKSCVVVADGTIHAQNNGQFAGSGQARSFILLLSTASCDGSSTSAEPCASAHHNAAIDLHNNATGAIFYSANGLLNMHNGVNAKEIVAKKLRIDNNAVVAYETGLVDLTFSTGPSGSWDIASWREAE